MKKNLIAILLLLYSCGPPLDDVELYPDKVGHFLPYSLEALVPIDGNFDGRYSKNVVDEIGYSPSKIYIASDNESKQLRFMSSFPSILASEYPGLLDYEYYPTTIWLYTTIDPSDLSVVSSVPMEDSRSQAMESEMKVTEFEYLDDQTVRIKLYHDKIYDMNLKKWTPVYMEGIYIRQPD